MRATSSWFQRLSLTLTSYLVTNPHAISTLYDPAIEIEAFFENFDLDHEHGKVQDPAHAALLEEKYRTKVVDPPLKASSFTIMGLLQWMPPGSVF